MSARKHDTESEGANPRDHARPHRPFWRHAHRDWRVWIVAVLMIALMFVYVMTNSLSLKPGRGATQPTPEAVLP